MGCRLNGTRPITWTNDGSLSIWLQGTNLHQNLYISFQLNVYSNVAHKIAKALSGPWCVCMWTCMWNVNKRWYVQRLFRLAAFIQWHQCIMYFISAITLTLNDGHGVSNYRSIECLFSSLFRLITKNIKGQRYCPFVMGIHRWPVDSPHIGTVTRKSFHLMTS